MSNIKSVRNLKPKGATLDELAYSFSYKSNPNSFSFLLRYNYIKTPNDYKFTLTHNLESFVFATDLDINKPTFFTI